MTHFLQLVLFSKTNDSLGLKEQLGSDLGSYSNTGLCGCHFEKRAISLGIARRTLPKSLQHLAVSRHVVLTAVSCFCAQQIARGTPNRTSAIENQHVYRLYTIFPAHWARRNQDIPVRALHLLPRDVFEMVLSVPDLSKVQHHAHGLQWRSDQDKKPPVKCRGKSESGLMFLCNMTW